MTRPRFIASLTAPLDGPSKALAAAAFAPLMVQWAFIVAFIWPRLGTLDYLRLHYTAASGVDWIDDWRMVFVFPVFGLAAWVVDLVLASRLAVTSHAMARLVLATLVFIEILLAVGGILAVLLNG